MYTWIAASLRGGGGRRRNNISSAFTIWNCTRPRGNYIVMAEKQYWIRVFVSTRNILTWKISIRQVVLMRPYSLTAVS